MVAQSFVLLGGLGSYISDEMKLANDTTMYVVETVRVTWCDKASNITLAFYLLAEWRAERSYIDDGPEVSARRLPVGKLRAR